jgi:natural product biosynthesis luciferase-like monooxygenase protein
MAKLNCLLIGDELLLAQCADHLLVGGHSIEAIVTSNKSVRDWALFRTIPVIEPSADWVARATASNYDWFFSIANLRIVPEPVWRHARQGAANFHDGILPRFAGVNTPSWAIMEGEKLHGVTWHAITDGIDEGDIYASQTFPIADDETALTLNTKCFEAGISTFAAMLKDIEQGSLTARRQDFSAGTYYGRHKRPEAAATLRFDKPADELSRLVRALEFGANYVNPVATPKVRFGSDVFTVTALQVLEEEADGAPGLVVSVDQSGAIVATADKRVLIEGTLRKNGRAVSLSSMLHPGASLPLLDRHETESLSAVVAEITPHERFFRRALAATTDVAIADIKAFDETIVADIQTLPLPLSENRLGEHRVALAAAFLARLSGQAAFDVAYSCRAITDLCNRHPGYFASSVPLRMEVSDRTTVADLLTAIGEDLRLIRNRRTYLLDVVLRDPQLRAPHLTLGIVEADDPSEASAIEGCALTFVFTPRQISLLYDRSRISELQVRDLAARFVLLAHHVGESAPAIADLPLMSEAERTKIVYDWNSTEQDYDRQACVHQLIERQVDLTPDDEALSFRGRSLTYREMDERANKLAHALISLQVGPEVLVGLYLPRSLDLVVGGLAVHKAGGAYVPLDPAFPADRLAFMIQDSNTKVVLTERRLAGSHFLAGLSVVCIEDVLAGAAPTARPSCNVVSDNLAYVIFTSGSTGQPKGVMVEHRNVVNFFAGMDERVPRSSERRNVWLAVTSLSFDISVLELFWTLARGFKVVIHASEMGEGKIQQARSPAGSKALGFGLFYWGNDAGAGPAKYRMLLEGAKFADEHGFQAVWTPERHFHAFGGPYPNPAVTGAAVAAVTKNVSIRAGSCVLPLHHPARVAEEWAVIDNLSAGRVALAFASGWMPEDFVLRPENAPPNNKERLARDIETVRKLWRGERVDFDFAGGLVGVITQPRPVQKELPVWLTTAGNPESYQEAARLGANVLTHLLGQSIDELAEKIRLYRQTLREVGRDPADYTVTLMLHTLVGENREAIRDLCRGPMKEYLRSAAALIKQYAWSFPAFKKPQGVSRPMDIDLQSLAEDDMDAILEFAFRRYFDDSGLFGTLDDARARVEQVAAAGVDEIACLIDFGLPVDEVLQHLEPLAGLVRSVRGGPTEETQSALGLGAEIRTHRVTHLQCTPSMARMFLLKEEDRRALGEVRHLFIGGEALSGSLVSDLRSVTDASIENMYGPTETTIWSSTCTALPTQAVVPLGRPIVNTQLYILDGALNPLPPGVPGELYIGGEGVSRGYLGREELTMERFLRNPFASGRIYRTGDLARFTPEGALQFLGRADHQVKVRGYRIELGEIEARISTFPGIREAVVIAREDQADDVRIVAYLLTDKPNLDEVQLRVHLASGLPDYMVPAHFVTMEDFPLTPNAKVDRKRLPKPEDVRRPLAQADYVAPTDSLQQKIAQVFAQALGLERIGILDSFFALGGHSLLAVQVHRDLRATVAPDLTITDLFRFPTVHSLAEHISDRSKASQRLSRVADRAAMRRNALGERRADLSRVRDVV